MWGCCPGLIGSVIELKYMHCIAFLKLENVNSQRYLAIRVSDKWLRSV